MNFSKCMIYICCKFITLPLKNMFTLLYFICCKRQSNELTANVYIKKHVFEKLKGCSLKVYHTFAVSSYSASKIYKVNMFWLKGCSLKVSYICCRQSNEVNLQQMYDISYILKNNLSASQKHVYFVLYISFAVRQPPRNI